MVETYKVTDNIVGLRDMTPEEKAQRIIDVDKWNIEFDNIKLEKIKKAEDKVNATNKLKALGLTDDEIKAIKGIK